MRQQQGKDGIEDIVDKIYENYKGRSVVLWGKYHVSDTIAETLKEKYEIDTAFYVDGDHSKIDYRIVFPPNCLDQKSSEYYVVIPLAFYPSIKEKLIRGGYKPNIDYYYFSDCAVKITEDYYEDAHGNKFIGKRDGIKFCFSGWNSTIIIGEDVRLDKTLELYMHNENVFELGDRVNIIGSVLCLGKYKNFKIERDSNINNCLIEVQDNAQFVVKEEVHTSSYNCMNRIHVEPDGIVIIGNETTFLHNFNIICPENTEIEIGKDCMFSWGINMVSNDCHTIFDVNTKQPINLSDTNHKRKIEIKDHVWIGMNCNILYDTYIGEGSIIGAGSLVKGIYPNNCIAAGNIAKIIKRDVSWCRTDGEKDINLCGKYVNPTKV